MTSSSITISPANTVGFPTPAGQRSTSAAIREWNLGNDVFVKAETQNNLGKALAKLSQLKWGPEKISLAREAVPAFDRAILEWDQELERRSSAVQVSLKTLKTHNIVLMRAAAQANLGNALVLLSDGGAEKQALQRAIDVYRSALHVFQQSGNSRQQAMTMNNSGNSMTLLAEIDNDPNPLRYALEYLRNALCLYEKMNDIQNSERVTMDLDTAEILLRSLRQIH